MIDKLYGLKIRNLDGSEFIFNEKTAPATNLWTRYVTRRDGITPDGGWLTYKWTCPNQVPEGYGFQVVSFKSAEVTFRQVGDRRYVSGTTDKMVYSTSNRKITVMGLMDYDLNYVKIIAFPTAESQKVTSGFGLKVSGSSIFLENTPPLGYAYATHKAKVFIDKFFDIGKVFPGLTIENAIFFFYTDDNKSFIRLEASNVTSWEELKWWRYVSRNRNSTGITDYSSAWYWVIAFTNVPSEQLDTPGFGLKIRNINEKKVTFNSQMGVMTRPITLPSNQIPINSGISIDDIRRPMYTPTVVGEVFSSNGGLGWWRDLNIGNIGESEVGLLLTSTLQDRGHHGDYTVARTALPAIFLDAADYFPFP